VERHGTPAQRTRFFESLTLMALRRDRYLVSEGTLADARAALAASRDLSDLNAIAFAQFGLAFTLLWHGDLDEAEANMLAALEMAQRAGNLTHQTLLLTYQTIICRQRRRIEATRQYVSRCLAAAEEADMPDYVGTAKANLAWLAWCEGNLAQAQDKGQAALELWAQTPIVYPFQWLALWPLMTVALARDEFPEAIHHAQAMLDSLQQRLPDALTGCLEEAIRAGEQGQPEAARMQLDRAIQLAQEKRYL
jgi:tetratricopeptide (TPR) repeat protein